jgi:hypothetical protein
MKKLVTLALAGVCALAFLAVADAGTVNRIEADKNVKTQDNLVKTSHVYANTASNTYNTAYFSSATGWSIDYIYSGDITNSTTVFNNLRNALNNPYAGLVPSVVNEAGKVGLLEYDVTSRGEGELDTSLKDWSNVGTVASNVIPGRGAITESNADGIDAATLEEEASEHDNEVDESVQINKKNEFLSVLSTSVESTWVMKDGKLVRENTIMLNVEKTIISSKKANKYVSPLVLDLTGNGVLQASNGQNLPGHELVEGNMILADFYGDGFEIGMEWVGPQDGLLVAPKADGTVDMSCLFGTAGGYDNGYEKLSLYDTNNDKVVKGEELNGLSIWQDANRNGIAEAGEVKTVQDLGITEISLNANDMYVSSFKMNGKTNKMWDWWPNAVELVKVAAK